MTESRSRSPIARVYKRLHGVREQRKTEERDFRKRSSYADLVLKILDDRRYEIFRANDILLPRLLFHRLNA